MPHALIHDMEAVWPTVGPGLTAALDPATFVQGATSLRLEAGPGSLNSRVELALPGPLDLSNFDELRFWISSARGASGSLELPFFLELSYLDAGDLPGEEHRWFLAINEPGEWEQRRIGIENDRRSAVTAIRFRCLTGDPFTVHLDELIAVREDMLLDLEQAVVARLTSLPNLAGIPVLVDSPSSALPATTPAVILTLIDAREDAARSTSYVQRDSFRPRGSLLACSTRASAQAFRADYQVAVRAPSRTLELQLHAAVLARLRALETAPLAESLRINGALAPVTTLPPPPQLVPAFGLLAPVYVRIGTRMEVADRIEHRWPIQEIVVAAQLDAPVDQELVTASL